MFRIRAVVALVFFFGFNTKVRIVAATLEYKTSSIDCNVLITFNRLCQLLRWIILGLEYFPEVMTIQYECMTFKE